MVPLAACRSSSRTRCTWESIEASARGGGVHPRDPVLGALFVGGEPVEGALQRDDLAGAVGVVGGFEDRPPRGELFLGAGQRDLGGVDVWRAWRLVDHLGGDARAHGAHKPGLVDEGVEHFVHHVERLRGGLVAALEGDQVRHFFIERDAGDGLALVGDGGEDRLRGWSGRLVRSARPAPTCATSAA